MKVEHILEQGSGNWNEDYLIMAHDIFDGATSLTDAWFKGGKSGGGMACSIAGQVFLRNHHPLARLGTEANDFIRPRMERCRIDLSSAANCGAQAPPWSGSRTRNRMVPDRRLAGGLHRPGRRLQGRGHRHTFLIVTCLPEPACKQPRGRA